MISNFHSCSALYVWEKFANFNEFYNGYERTEHYGNFDSTWCTTDGRTKCRTPCLYVMRLAVIVIVCNTRRAVAFNCSRDTQGMEINRMSLALEILDIAITATGWTPASVIRCHL